MATKKFKTAPGNVVDFPAPVARRIDVKKLLLEGQSAPTVVISVDLQKAIDARARVLSGQAFELCKEHLQRRVAYCCELGSPTRVIDTAKAFSVIARGDLGDALAHSYLQKLHGVSRMAEAASHMAREFEANMKIALSEAKGN